MLIAAAAPTLDFHSALLIPLRRPGVGTAAVYLRELETFGLIFFSPPHLIFFFTSVPFLQGAQ